MQVGMLILLITVQLLASLSEEIRPALHPCFSLPPSSHSLPPYQEYRQYHPLSLIQVLHLLSQQNSCPHRGLGEAAPQVTLQGDQQDQHLLDLQHQQALCFQSYPGLVVVQCRGVRLYLREKFSPLNTVSRPSLPADGLTTVSRCLVAARMASAVSPDVAISI